MALRIEELCDRPGRPPSETVLPGAQERGTAARSARLRGTRLRLQPDYRNSTPAIFPRAIARFFVVFAPSIFPGAWGGIVPPIRLAGRHKKIDAYLRSNPCLTFAPGTVCWTCVRVPSAGFQMDAAEAFPEWQIVGADPAFEPYLLYDERGNYAAFNLNGALRYFQPGRPEEFLRLYNATITSTTIQNFSEAFAQLLLPALPADGRS